MRRIAFAIMLAAVTILNVHAETKAKQAEGDTTSESGSEQLEQSVSTKQSATESSSEASGTMSAVVLAPKGTFGGAVSIGYSSSLYEKSAAESQGQGTFSARLDSRIGRTNHVVRAFISGYQQEKGGEETQFNDGFMAWVNNSFWTKGNVLTIGQQVRAIAPTSRESHKRDEKITGVMLAPLFVFNLTPMGLLGVSLVYLPQATKNFHKYEQNRANGNNVSHSLSHILSLNWSFTDHMYWRNDFVYGQSWSYSNLKRDDAYQFASEIGYSWSSGVNLGLGVSNSGAIRNFENGNDQTIRLFNDKTASVYSELSYLF